MTQLPVFLYIIENDKSCLQVWGDLKSLADEVPHRLVVIDIQKEEYLFLKYKEIVPVVEIGPYLLSKEIKRQDLQVALMAAQARINNQNEFISSNKPPKELKTSVWEKFILGITRHYMALINLSLFLLIAFSFIPPVLMKAGLKEPAHVIYSVYRLFCHELGFRSYFLFGKQAIYPRELAGIIGLITYEEISQNITENANDFAGSDIWGYKIALCQRDLAMYGAALLYGLTFVFKKKSFKPIHFWILILATIPILVDGLSQLPGLMPDLAPTWLPIRESNPILRTLTGAIFGFALTAFLFPYFEINMQNARGVLVRKDYLIKTINNRS
jgi:uncharacterized membrane protein